jgi:AbrB family looped-hinge helix DNA binding protein
MTLHSTITRKGQTTIPGPVRAALRVKAGDKLAYEVTDGKVTIRPIPGLRALKGCLASDKGRGMTFAQIREAAAKNWRASRERPAS